MYPELSSACRLCPEPEKVKQDKIIVGNSEQPRWNSQMRSLVWVSTLSAHLHTPRDSTIRMRMTFVSHSVLVQGR